MSSAELPDGNPLLPGGLRSGAGGQMALPPATRSPVLDLDQLRRAGWHLRHLTADSRAVRPDSTFLAYPGARFDGREFIAQAVAAGASEIIWERAGFAWPGGLTIRQQAVSGLRTQASMIADAAYHHPSRQIQVVGFTGTNGKTSCSHWLAQLLEAVCISQERDSLRTHSEGAAVVVGTLGHGVPGALKPLINTTPDPILLQHLLAHYRAQGVRFCAMEVSSHGLEQERVAGINFRGAVFTNLSRDHLDYHGTLEAYAAAKSLLFAAAGLKFAVLNLDDELGWELAQRLSAHGGIEVIGYTQEGRVIPNRVLGLSAHAVLTPLSGVEFELHSPWGHAQVRTALMGRFNVSNTLAVLGSALALNFPLDGLVRALGTLAPPPGRLERWGGPPHPWVVVDYAHSPAALEQVLRTLRATLGQGGGLWCVFGCGGERDQGKRPLMGEVASRLADTVILTSDNPRSELPLRIIEQIQAGCARPCQQLEDRAMAIRSALTQAKAGDVVLIAGKGHEQTQEVAGQRLPFSDRAEVIHWLEEKRRDD